MLLSRIIKRKKFMWDGNEYGSEEEAKEVINKYAGQGFETEIIKENGKIYIYTRRVVTEIKIEGT